jgi:hypothetical protein
MNEKVNIFQTHFAETAEECQRFCYMSRAKELQVEACGKLRELEDEVHTLKAELISLEDEDAANAMLSFEKIIHALMDELNMWVALKDDDPGTAWNYLVDAEVKAHSAFKVHPVGEHLTGYLQHLHILEHVLFPPQMFFSVGVIVEEAVCSICGEEYGECDHEKGKAYMGQECVRNIKHVRMIEGSIVEKPANKRCRIISITDECGLRRDLLTWRVISSVSKKPEQDI